jgi:hypothetical protein
MSEIRVAVQKDHLEKLAAAKKPILAIAELIWNSLDADATAVRVYLQRNDLGGIEEIRVVDNGHGIQPMDAEAAFGNLGGSWKAASPRSRLRGRLLHGRAGKGRFRAFSLGGHVVWRTRSTRNGSVEEYTITGDRSDLSVFACTDPKRASSKTIGTEVVISAPVGPLPSLLSASAIVELAGLFALYLSQYSDVEVTYDGTRLDPRAIQKDVKTFDLGKLKLGNGELAAAVLTVIEWSVDVERSIFLCDADGFVLEKAAAGIHAPGFSFTAYVKSDYMRDLLGERSAPLLEELDPDLSVFLDAARSRLRQYFREKLAGETHHLVEQWKKEAIYPYEGEPIGLLEQVERQVFDVLALSVNDYLPEFEQARPESKRLQFRLLRQALEESPSSVQRIISEVLDLPKKKQDELAELLERTSFAAIINASKVVADRLDFLRALEIWLYQYKDHLKERAQLHKLLEARTWLFGEQFALMASNKGLTEVLKKHISLLGRTEISPKPVRREDGSIGIVDLMLSSAMRPTAGSQPEHLIVELKRPAQDINNEVFDQIESYANAVATDERFKGTDVRWVFWAVSNDLSSTIERRARMKDKPVGLVYESRDMPLTIWVKRWGEIIEDCKARLEFFRENLEYTPDDESALERLRKIHESLFLPPAGGETLVAGSGVEVRS